MTRDQWEKLVTDELAKLAPDKEAHAGGQPSVSVVRGAVVQRLRLADHSLPHTQRGPQRFPFLEQEKCDASFVFLIRRGALPARL